MYFVGPKEDLSSWRLVILSPVVWLWAESANNIIYHLKKGPAARLKLQLVFPLWIGTCFIGKGVRNHKRAVEQSDTGNKYGFVLAGIWQMRKWTEEILDSFGHSGDGLRSSTEAPHGWKWNWPCSPSVIQVHLQEFILLPASVITQCSCYIQMPVTKVVAELSLSYSKSCITFMAWAYDGSHLVHILPSTDCLIGVQHRTSAVQPQANILSPSGPPISLPSLYYISV